MTADAIPIGLIEDVLEDVGEALDERFGSSKWIKPLYWLTVVVMFTGVAIYYVW